MSVLVSPASYLTEAQFRAMPLDYDLSSYTDANITDLLVRASGAADSIMRRSLLATERTKRMTGDGTNTLTLNDHPILYVRKIQFFQPGVTGFTVPLSYFSVDTITGRITQYAPIALTGIGYLPYFPQGLEIDVTYARGYGYNPIVAPSYSLSDAQGSGLAPGQYTIGITTRTMTGETLPTFQTYTTATGSILVTVNPVLGAYLYRVFLVAGASSAGATLVAEIPATQFNSSPITGTITSAVAPSGFFAEAAPAIDTSALPTPNAIIEAIRLLAMGILWEQNNLANRGVYKESSGAKSIMWRSTEGTSGKGISYMQQQATELLRPYCYQAIL